MVWPSLKNGQTFFLIEKNCLFKVFLFQQMGAGMIGKQSKPVPSSLSCCPWRPFKILGPKDKRLENSFYGFLKSSPVRRGTTGDYLLAGRTSPSFEIQSPGMRIEISEDVSMSPKPALATGTSRRSDPRVFLFLLFNFI